MSVSPLEIMRGSILLHEGKCKKVRAIGDYIQFEGTKEWIGGSLVNGEPITELWLKSLGFQENDGQFYWADPLTSRILYIHRMDEKTSWIVKCSVNEDGPIILHVIFYIHQLQLLFFGVVGEHLKIPKLPK